MKDLLLSAIPMINETSDAFEKSYDWPDANYEANAEVASTVSEPHRWKIEQRLSGAPGIEQLLLEGKAAWAVEYVCAETMFIGAATEPHQPNSDKEKASEEGLSGSVTVAMEARDIGDSAIYLWPGVITTEHCELNTTGSTWGDERLVLGSGRWLVRGAPLKPEHAQNSPVVFKGDHKHAEGQVSIKLDSSGQDSRFIIYANPDRIDALKEEKTGALLGCFATALAMLPNDPMFEIEKDEEGEPYSPNWPLGTELINVLRSKDSGIALWNNAEEWDPMKAASLILPLRQISDESGQE